MKHKGLLIALIVLAFVGGAFFLGLIISFAFSGVSGGSGFSLSGGRVGIIQIDGTILSAGALVGDIEDFRKDESIKSVVIRLESPGGSVGASQEILEAVRRLAEKKPVVASMGSIAASGAYYIACGASQILANPGTITGSIGVRMEHIMIGDLLQWAKIRHETLKSGQFKDLAAFDRPMSPEERAILQGLLEDMHLQFKEAVANARHLSAEEVDALADGRVYTGRKALELKLVDALGGLSEAVALAGKLGGIRGEPKTVRPHRRLPLVERLFESARALAKMGQGASLDYWQPLFFMNVQ